jgi:hypothetical protein
MSEHGRVAGPRRIEANLPGPSRRITVEPIEVPASPEQEPTPGPAPVEEPVRAPEREPAPVR